jgi:uncharacterized protein (DUF1697 family)
VTIYIALLRGINVGGKTAVKMADLHDTFSAAGAEDVRTYINSGNVLLKTDLDEPALLSRLVPAIRLRFGWDIPLVLRTADEWNQIVANLPYTPPELAAAAEAAADVESNYVALMDSAPTPDKINLVSQFCNDREHLRVRGREGYLLIHMSVRLSKLAQKLDRLSPVVTVRNWNTICKLAELAGEMR